MFLEILVLFWPGCNKIYSIQIAWPASFVYVTVSWAGVKKYNFTIFKTFIREIRSRYSVFFPRCQYSLIFRRSEECVGERETEWLRTRRIRPIYPAQFHPANYNSYVYALALPCFHKATSWSIIGSEMHGKIPGDNKVRNPNKAGTEVLAAIIPLPVLFCTRLVSFSIVKDNTLQGPLLWVRKSPSI